VTKNNHFAEVINKNPAIHWIIRFTIETWESTKNAWHFRRTANFSLASPWRAFYFGGTISPPL